MKTRRCTKPTPGKKVNTNADCFVRLFTTKPNTDTLLQSGGRVKVYSCTHCDGIFLNASEYENHKKRHAIGKLESPGTSPSKNKRGSSVSDKQEHLGTVTHKTAGDEDASAAVYLLKSYPSTSQQKHAPTATLSVTSPNSQQKERTTRRGRPRKQMAVLQQNSSSKKVESALQLTRPTKGKEVSQQSRSSIKEQNIGPKILYLRPVKEYAASMQPYSLSSMPDHIEHSDTESEPDNAALEVKQEPGIDTGHTTIMDPKEHTDTTSPLRAKLHNCPLCDKRFVDLEALKLHVLIHANNKSHVCDICGKMFTLESNLITHLKTHTDERPNTCVKCGLAFGSPVELRTHFKSHRFEKPYVCTYCDVGFATGPELTTHMKSSHTGKDPLNDAHCEQCGGICQAKPKVFVDKSQKPYVVRIISQGTCKPISKPVEPAKKPETIQPFKGISQSIDYEKCKVKGPLVLEKTQPLPIFPANEAAKQPHNKPYSCKYCSEGFDKSIDMRKHIRIHTGKNFHECTICLKRFYQITQLKRHIQTHTGEKPFKCVHCDKGFILKYDLTQHLFTHSDEKPFKCTLCKKLFKQKDQLVVHKRLKHSDNKVHFCVECGASFPFSWELKKHMRNHTGETLYQCTVCGATFKTSTALKEHSITHTGIKPHVCPYCEKQFVRVSSLKLHIRCHEGDKPFLCTVCGETFVKQSRLDDHARRHSGIKPCECTYGCGKSFYTAADLRKHTKVHTDEANLCPHCGRAFSQIGNLRIHINRVHDGSNRHNECTVCRKVFVTDFLLQRHMGTHATHPCNLCGNIFNTRGLLYRHMRNVHKMEINPSRKLGSNIKGVQITPGETQGQQSLESSVPDNVVILPSDLNSQTDMYKPPISAQIIPPSPIHPRTNGSVVQFPAVRMHSILQRSQERTSMYQPPQVLSEPSLDFSQAEDLDISSNLEQTQIITHTVQAPHIVSQSSSLHVQSPESNRQQNTLDPQPGTQKVRPHQSHNQTCMPNPQPRIQIIQPQQVCTKSNKSVVTSSGLQKASDTLVTLKKPKSIQPPQLHNQSNRNTLNQGSSKPITKPIEPAEKPVIIQPLKAIPQSVENRKVKEPLAIKNPEPMPKLLTNEAAKQPYIKHYSCKYCSKRFHKSIKLRKHIQTHTSKQKPLKCTVCKKMFKQKDRLVLHKQLKHGHRKLHSCVECEASFPFLWKLKKHMWKHTRERLYQCTVCEATFKTSTALKEHNATHTGVKPHVCPYCKRRFLRVSSLRFHIRRHEGNKPHICAVCGKGFATQSILNEHVRLHEGYKPYLCDFCGREFLRQSQLSLHVRTHTGEKPFECTYGCGKSFINISNLNSHIKVHTGEKPNLCPHCGKTFSQLGNLRMHIKKVHDGHERHNECTICRKVFVTDFLLQRHMGTHATHPCNLCGNIFNTKGLLYRHTRNVHKVEISPLKRLGSRIKATPDEYNDQHECTVCKKVFGSDYRLQRHKGVHDTHQCKVCGKIFAKRGGLYTHMRNVHGVKITSGNLGPHINVVHITPDETQNPQSLESSASENIIQPSDLHSQTIMSNPSISAQTIQPPPLHQPAEVSVVQFPTIDMSSLLESSTQVLSVPSMDFSQPSGLHISSNLEHSKPNIQQTTLNPQPGIQTVQRHQVHKQTSLPNPQTKMQIIQPHQIYKKSNKFVVRSSGLQITSDTLVTLKRPKDIQPPQIDNQCNKNTLNPHIKPDPILQTQASPQSSHTKAGAKSSPKVPPKKRICVKQPQEHQSPTQSVGKKQKTKAAVSSECVYCGLRFHRTSDLVAHIRKHTGHHLYKCSVCGKAFITAAFLNNHQKGSKTCGV